MFEQVTEFVNVSIQGIPLLFVVWGFVEAFKQAGLKGQWVYFSSLAVGIIFGMGYQIAVSGPPADFAQGFAYAIFGLALGFTASKTFDVAVDIVSRVKE